jgi:hypothetical protein
MLSTIKKWAIETAYRLWYADKKIAFINSMGWLAKLYFLVYVGPIIFLIPGAQSMYSIWYAFAVGALTFIVIHTLLGGKLKTGNAEWWATHDRQRTSHLYLAIDLLAGHIDHESLGGVEKHRFLHEILEVIKFEVEKARVDADRFYLNVSLLVPDETDSRYLKVIARADTSRPIGIQYEKQTLTIGTAMDTKALAYEPNFKKEGKDYRCILAVPIVDTSAGIATAVGVISIDSGKPYHFAGIHEKIATQILPYVNLLKLVLRK